MKKKYIPSSPSSNSSAHTELPKTHIPVLLQEVMAVLSIAKDDIVVDATVGGMGHAREILSRLGKRGMFIGFDADASALERARSTLVTSSHTVHLVNDNFRTMDTHLK